MPALIRSFLVLCGCALLGTLSVAPVAAKDPDAPGFGTDEVLAKKTEPAPGPAKHSGGSKETEQKNKVKTEPVNSRDYGFSSLGEFLKKSDALLEEQRNALERLQKARELVQSVAARNENTAKQMAQAAGRSLQAAERLGLGEAPRTAASGRRDGDRLQLGSKSKESQLPEGKRPDKQVEQEKHLSASPANSKPSLSVPNASDLLKTEMPTTPAVKSAHGDGNPDLALYPELAQVEPSGENPGKSAPGANAAEDSPTQVARQFQTNSLKEALKAQLNRDIRERAAGGAADRLKPQSGTQDAVAAVVQEGRSPASTPEDGEKAGPFRMNGSETDEAVRSQMRNFGGNNMALEVLGAESARLFDRVHAAHRRWRRTGG